MRKNLIKVFATMCIVTIAFVACSSDSDDEASDTTTTTTEATAQGSSLVEIASGDPRFSTLAELVQLSGLGEALSAGQFTVFAPTNDAFAALDEDTLAALKANPEAIQAVLTSHAVADVLLLTSELEDGQELITVSELTLTANVTDEGVTLSDAAGNTVSIVQPDIEASNGVIHVISGLFLPDGLDL